MVLANCRIANLILRGGSGTGFGNGSRDFTGVGRLLSGSVDIGWRSTPSTERRSCWRINRHLRSWGQWRLTRRQPWSFRCHRSSWRSVTNWSSDTGRRRRHSPCARETWRYQTWSLCGRKSREIVITILEIHLWCLFFCYGLYSFHSNQMNSLTF